MIDRQAPLPGGTGVRSRRLANLIVIGVGGTAGYVSWHHLYDLGRDSGASHDEALLTPFTIDGMIVAGTLELRQARLDGRPAKPAAYLAILVGVIGTIAGNVAAADDTITSRLYFASPAIAFLISVEVLFGKPLTRNLWDMIRGWWTQRAQARRRRANDRPGAPVRERGPVPTVADPAPDRTPDTAQPVPDPAPEVPQPPAPRHVQPAEKPSDVTGRPRPPVTPARPRTPARRRMAPESVPVAPPGPTRDERGRVVGTKREPAREVDGEILIGDALKERARRWAAVRLQRGASREGLGVWVARRFDPPMSDRWGQERVAELALPTTTGPVGEPASAGSDDPAEPEPAEPEPAEPDPDITSSIGAPSRDREPAGV